MYKVTVKPEIAKLRDNETGTRNVLVGGRPNGTVLTFSKHPVYLPELPDEVKADDMLVIVEEIGPHADVTVDETPAPELGPTDTTAPEAEPVAEAVESPAEPLAPAAPVVEPKPDPEPAPRPKATKAGGAKKRRGRPRR